MRLPFSSEAFLDVFARYNAALWPVALVSGLAAAAVLAAIVARPARPQIDRLAVYALAYPGVNLVLGHAYLATPTFGVPCPTTIFTVGMLLTCRRPPAVVSIIPVLWSLVAGSATWSLGVPADVVLIVCAPLLAGYVVVRRLHRRAAAGATPIPNLQPTFRGRTP